MVSMAIHSVFFPLNMVILHSYVKLPEGMLMERYGKVMVFKKPSDDVVEISPATLSDKNRSVFFFFQFLASTQAEKRSVLNF